MTGDLVSTQWEKLSNVYTVKTELREVFEKCFNLKQKCLVATEISHAVFHNSDTECLDHPNSYLQLFGQ